MWMGKNFPHQWTTQSQFLLYSVMEKTGIRVVGLAKKFSDVWALRSLDLDIAPGEFVVLLGPSGCGKTTALRMIAGLEEPTEGSVYIGEREVGNVAPADRDIAMVFQNYALYPHMTVEANLEFGLKMRGVPKEKRTEKVTWAASLLGLADLLKRKPGQLSGGQRQRVALGRAMVREPKAYLFDEPLSNLDARLRAEMRAEIADVHRKVGATMIFVTHDQVEAMTLGNRIAVLKAGVLQQFGTPMEIYGKPSNLFVAKFVGTPSINTVAGSLDSGEGKTSFHVGDDRWNLPGYEYHGDVTLGIRPEKVGIVDVDSEEARFIAKIQRVEALGNESLVWFEGCDGSPWASRAEPEFAGAVGEDIGVAFAAKDVFVFEGTEGLRLSPKGMS